VRAACELHLIRDWDAAWRTFVGPWLREAASLRRDLVVVPTRGQAQALKLRCVREGVPLLGVEFLTPSLLRRKLRALDPAAHPILPVELLRFHLEAIVTEELAKKTSGDASWGFWKSLATDLDRALAEFTELQQAGFAAGDFGFVALREVFGLLEARVREMDAGFAAIGERAFAAQPVADPAFERVLLLGFGADHGGDFDLLTAFVRRASAACVLLPEPDFERSSRLAESWVQRWEVALEVESGLPEVTDPLAGAAVADLWSGSSGNAEAARVLVGRTREDEIVLVARQVGDLLAAGAQNIAVVFPRADAAHRRLAHLLAARGIPFNDLVESAAAPAVEVQIQAGLLRFVRRGGRMDELLALWPMLQAVGLTTATPAEARRACDSAFDETQDHALAANRERWQTDERVIARELARMAALLPEPWPEMLTLSDAVARFEATSRAFRLPLPDGWSALAQHAVGERRLFPMAVVVDALARLLPSRGAVADAPGRGRFAPVTLTTRRRAAACAWEHVFVVEANAGVWPRRQEPFSWLTDERREELNRRAGRPLLATAEDLFALERQAMLDLARNTAGAVWFSAALFDEQEPEIRMAPNAWLERVLVARGGASAEFGPEAAFAALAIQANANPPRDEAAVDGWERIWHDRRNPETPFNEYFFSGPLPLAAPGRLAALGLEKGLSDPVVLWFETVLETRRTEWRPLVRSRQKLLGQVAHRVMARALRGLPAEGDFTVRPDFATATQHLVASAAAFGARWPANRFWDSVRAEVEHIARALLEKTFALPALPFVAVETHVPRGTTIPVGTSGDRIELSGRIDVVFSDRPAWRDAQIALIDFKTGSDLPLTVARMANGHSIQLGLYLAGARSAGAADGAVFMVKPDAGPSGRVTMAELPDALVRLDRLARHRATGCYGALTPDRTGHSHGFEWPIACAPIEREVLQRKFTQTFGSDNPDGGDDDDE
jgi:hypothetical protein